ncbi:MAG TPA: iron-containing alcohol dehydrogenase [Virgibacillus sp.]|nr:iron-containing alcohol dehydrogenase [Virgibacillus sp.]HLR69221.1 iron-containing alcohol dehydrogenase [Virgibacillus sp.]
MFNFVSPKTLHHGKDSLQKLYIILEDLQVERLTIISDPVLKDIGAIDEILNRIENMQVEFELITDVVPEPPLDIGNKIVNQTRAFNPDLVVGIGGGSALDIAKTASVLVKNEGTIEEYVNLTGNKKITHAGIPKILIPTTAGTGAEVTDIAVFSLEDTKDVITHEYLLADYAIVDPMLTISLPPRVTAASGIDALTHAIESYTSVHATPITKKLSLEAIQLIVPHIRTAVWNGENIEARENMALGSLLAGLSFYNAGVAGVHALAYPLGGLFNIPHGESNAVLLPYVYDVIWSSCMEKMIDIAEIFEIPMENRHKRDIVIDLIQHLQYLIQDVGLPLNIQDYQIKKEDIASMVDNGIKQTRLLNRSPRKLDKELIETIYTNAYDGSLIHSL